MRSNFEVKFSASENNTLADTFAVGADGRAQMAGALVYGNRPSRWCRLQQNSRAPEVNEFAEDVPFTRRPPRSRRLHLYIGDSVRIVVAEPSECEHFGLWLDLRVSCQEN